MEVVIRQDRRDAERYTAHFMAAFVRSHPGCVLGLATGGTPEAVYAELVRLYRKGEVDFGAVTTFNLDEYVGLPPEHEQSYRHYMAARLFNAVNIPEERTHFPDGTAQDIAAACRAYEEAIRRAGGIDLQLLGIGRDGHIGFNEPGSSLASRTRIKTLTAETIRDNARYFGSEDAVPRHVVTMGIGTICEARRIIMLATGANKAEAVAAMVEGPVTAMVPASALQMHPDVVVVVDEEAGSKLRLADYYRWVFEHKPDWQRIVR